jgi:hypothetical protein
MVEDPEAAGTDVLRLGATHLDGDSYADPAGHPFCSIRRPHWAEELSCSTTPRDRGQRAA